MHEVTTTRRAEATRRAGDGSRAASVHYRRTTTGSDRAGWRNMWILHTPLTCLADLQAHSGPEELQ